MSGAAALVKLRRNTALAAKGCMRRLASARYCSCCS